MSDLSARVQRLVLDPMHIAELVEDVIAENGEALRVLARAMGIVVAGANMRTDREQLAAIDRANTAAARVIFAAAIDRAGREIALARLH